MRKTPENPCRINRSWKCPPANQGLQKNDCDGCNKMTRPARTPTKSPWRKFVNTEGGESPMEKAVRHFTGERFDSARRHRDRTPEKS